MSELCGYGCGQPGKFYFKTANIWCCSKHYNQCPVNKKKMSELLYERHYYSETSKRKRELEAGLHTCTYCGGKAVYYLGIPPDGEERYSCQKKAKECPNYHNWISSRLKKMYKDNPEYLEFQRENVKKIASDPEVSEKKREAMLLLHRGDCDECKEFQKNFKLGHKNRRKKVD